MMQWESAERWGQTYRRTTSFVFWKMKVVTWSPFRHRYPRTAEIQTKLPVDKYFHFANTPVTFTAKRNIQQRSHHCEQKQKTLPKQNAN